MDPGVGTQLALATVQRSSVLYCSAPAPHGACVVTFLGGPARPPTPNTPALPSSQPSAGWLCWGTSIPVHEVQPGLGPGPLGSGQEEMGEPHPILWGPGPGLEIPLERPRVRARHWPHSASRAGQPPPVRPGAGPAGGLRSAARRPCHLVFSCTNSISQPVDLLLLSPKISAYSAARSVTVSLLRSTCQPLDQHLSAA